MSWQHQLQVTTQYDDERSDGHELSIRRYGPFDTLDEIVAQAEDDLAACLTAPGRPWDPGEPAA